MQNGEPRGEARAMSEAVAVAPGKAPSMGTFERYLTVWVALCIVVSFSNQNSGPDSDQSDTLSSKAHERPHRISSRNFPNFN